MTVKEVGRKVFRDQELNNLSVLHSAQDKYINFPCISQLALMFRKLQRCHLKRHMKHTG